MIKMGNMVLGRTSGETRRLGEKLTINVGRRFKLAQEGVRFSGDVLLDVNSPHMVLVCGKRGYGKSFTLGVIAEGLASIPEETKKNLSLVIIDTMGIFWTLQIENEDDLYLKKWGLTPRSFDIEVYFPEGLKERYAPYSRYFHEGFKMYPSELTLEDWMFLFDLGEIQAQTGLLSSILEEAYERHGKFYSIRDLLGIVIESEEKQNVKNALARKLEGALNWGFFSDKGKTIEDIIKPGKIVVLDFSGAGELPWNVRITLTAILAKKMYSKRAFARSKEEIRKIERGEMELMGIPLIWLFLDEAHIFVPTEHGTAATEPLLEWVRQGRRPGLSLVLATQQPGALDPRVLSQCDLLIIHRLTAGIDSQAIGTRISEIHGSRSVVHYMKRIPKEPGYAVVMDDQTEEIIPILIRPRQSWHAGESAKLEEYVKLTRELTESKQ